jgi:hypothetical protein
VTQTPWPAISARLVIFVATVMGLAFMSAYVAYFLSQKLVSTVSESGQFPNLVTTDMSYAFSIVAYGVIAAVLYGPFFGALGGALAVLVRIVVGRFSRTLFAEFLAHSVGLVVGVVVAGAILATFDRSVDLAIFIGGFGAIVILVVALAYWRLAFLRRQQGGQVSAS